MPSFTVPCMRYLLFICYSAEADRGARLQDRGVSADDGVRPRQRQFPVPDRAHPRPRHLAHRRRRKPGCHTPRPPPPPPRRSPCPTPPLPPSTCASSCIRTSPLDVSLTLSVSVCISHYIHDSSLSRSPSRSFSLCVSLSPHTPPPTHPHSVCVCVCVCRLAPPQWATDAGGSGRVLGYHSHSGRLVAEFGSYGTGISPSFQFGSVADLAFSANGTVVFVADGDGGINVGGRVLWQRL